MAPPFFQKSSTASPFSSGQTGARRASVTKADISRDLDIARGRKEFFSNNPNVSDDRALRRMKQADETQRFKNLYTKPVAGSSNLLQMTADAPRSLAEERMRLANIYGPTPGEILGDMGRGIGSIFRGIAEKGTPLMQLGKGILGGIQNFFTGANKTPGTTNQFSSFKQGLTNPQLSIFNYHLNSGNSPDFARQMALMGKPIAYPTFQSASAPSNNNIFNNLTEFGQMLANRVRSDRPGISDAELMQVLKRSNDAGFASQGRPVFTTGMFANGGIATFN